MPRHQAIRAGGLQDFPPLPAPGKIPASALVSVGCRVSVVTLLHSHATTRAAQDLLGKEGIVERLIPRGTSTYALVRMDDEIKGFPGQEKWPIQIADLYVITRAAASRALEPAPYTVGYSKRPVAGGMRHA